MPNVYTQPCARTVLRSSREDCSSDKPLMNSTGNTHGIRLRMTPPAKASSTACTKPESKPVRGAAPAGIAPGVAAMM